jgi:hypothetical protein
MNTAMSTETIAANAAVAREHIVRRLELEFDDCHRALVALQANLAPVLALTHGTPQHEILHKIGCIEHSAERLPRVLVTMQAVAFMLDIVRGGGSVSFASTEAEARMEAALVQGDATTARAWLEARKRLTGAY